MYIPVFVRFLLSEEDLAHMDFDDRGLCALRSKPLDLSVLISASLEPYLEEGEWYDILMIALSDGRLAIIDPCAHNDLIQEFLQDRYCAVYRWAERNVVESLQELVPVDDVALASGKLDPQLLKRFIASVDPAERPYHFLQLASMNYALHNITQYPFSDCIRQFKAWPALDLTGFQRKDPNSVEAVAVLWMHI